MTTVRVGYIEHGDPLVPIGCKRENRLPKTKQWAPRAGWRRWRVALYAQQVDCRVRLRDVFIVSRVHYLRCVECDVTNERLALFNFFFFHI